MKIDFISLLITCSVDRSLKDLERDLNREGFTLGYRPADKNIRTLRQALEKRGHNLNFLRYGEIEDICTSLKIRRKGKSIVTKNVPRAATGPDFKKIFMGSEQRYGKILEATLRIVRL